MNEVFDEKKLTNAKLFEMKHDQDVFVLVDKRCEDKCPGFIDARNRGDFETQFALFTELCHITIDNASFVYFFDFDFRFLTGINNITPAYDIILRQGLSDLIYEKEDTVFKKRYNVTIRSIMALAERIAKEAEHTEKGTFFQKMVSEPAASFREAVQRILFVNQLIWQTGSGLVGLGRLDRLLDDYYREDIRAGRLDRQGAKDLLKEAILILHRHVWYKSGTLLGDIGQAITVGGSGYDGQYESNDLTEMILEIVGECSITDPKIILRVNTHIPGKILEKAVSCMATGVGSPLLANDDVIIPTLMDFGISKEDAYDYCTSACWETLIGGKSSSMNNQASVSFVKAFNSMLAEELIYNLKSFEDVKRRFFFHIKNEVDWALANLRKQKYRRNTVYSVFLHNCRERKKDIVDGGAAYHNIGITTVGLANAVNSLLNIKSLVFEEHKYSMADVKLICLMDYQEKEEAVDQLKNRRQRYGVDEPEVIDLVNEILRYVTEVTKNFRTDIGGRVKFGVSSPNYIRLAPNEKATFDGRRRGEPMAVHISDNYARGYTQLLNFGAALDYGDNRFNGNVIDLMVNPSFIENHNEKFIQLLETGIKIGIFELQTNVVKSETLIDAKAHPEKHWGLIVRVWGFSALYVELPESYQDLLIERARQNERWAV